MRDKLIDCRAPKASGCRCFCLNCTATVLNSPRAVEMTIYVVRAFVELREAFASTRKLARKLAELERRLATHDQAITGILKTIRELMNPPQPTKRPIGFIELEEKKR